MADSFTGNSTNDDVCAPPEDHWIPHIPISWLLSAPAQNWHILGWAASGVLVLVTWIVAYRIIKRHMLNYYDPDIQRYKVRILTYPPIYALLAWVAYLETDFSVVIMFFASLSEAFAVYGLYRCLEAYLSPYRNVNKGKKVSMDIKLLGAFPFKLNSKWGFHFKTIIDILIIQFPLWTITDSAISIYAEFKGFYCADSFTHKGAYTYLTIIDFISLTVILSALITYISVFSEEWKRGHISSHGMFWCVKGPIMIIYWLGDILLSGLQTFGFIKGNMYWSATNIKGGAYTILICVTMFVVIFIMPKYFGPEDPNVQEFQHLPTDTEHHDHAVPLSPFFAFIDSFMFLIPQLLKEILLCGKDTFLLADKRRKVMKQKRKNQAHLQSEAVQEGVDLLKSGGKEVRDSKVSYSEAY